MVLLKSIRMKNKLLLAFLLLALQASVFAQSTDSIRINKLQQQNTALRKQITILDQRTQMLTKQVAGTSQKVKLLSEVVDQKVGGLHKQMDSIDNYYGQRIDLTESAVQETGTRQQRSVVWGIVIAVAIFLLVIVAWFILRKLIAKKGDDIELLRARADEINRQMVEKMGEELSELQKIVLTLSSPPKDGSKNSEPDHSIVLAIGDNLAIMESNLYRMDSKTPGHRTLTKAVEKMKNNLLQKGYDFVNMLGTEYIDGMNVDKVMFKDDDNNEEGKQIITAVRRPQINYNGIAIQLANIEVSQNI